MLVLGILLGVTLVHAEKASTESRPIGIIALDPGHGGNDMGVRGADNLIEKQVAMTFAGIMTERLKKTYKVVLTRKDDYQIDVFERPALANHVKADLFVSIHAGGSFRSYPTGMSLFYYDGASQIAAAFESQTSARGESPSAIKRWEQNRPELVKKSRRLTELVQNRLTQADKDLKLTSAGAPLIVMSGADMPAILIEIGTITNPLDAKALKDETHVSNMVHAICDAIDDFFSNEHHL